MALRFLALIVPLKRMSGLIAGGSLAGRFAGEDELPAAGGALRLPLREAAKPHSVGREEASDEEAEREVKREERVSISYTAVNTQVDLSEMNCEMLARGL